MCVKEVTQKNKDISMFCLCHNHPLLVKYINQWIIYWCNNPGLIISRKSWWNDIVILPVVIPIPKTSVVLSESLTFSSDLNEVCVVCVHNIIWHSILVCTYSCIKTKCTLVEKCMNFLHFLATSCLVSHKYLPSVNILQLKTVPFFQTTGFKFILNYFLVQI